MTETPLGPLRDGGHVVIIGGGPGGCACAIALVRLSCTLDRRVDVTLYEGKTFAGERHYNQCVGVLSPPIDRILQDELGVPFPWHLVQRRITGYVLHGERRSLVLDSPENEVSYALRRIQFDAYLLEQTRQAGVEVVPSRVTDLEISADGVTVYSESDCRRADVVVGAFGSDIGTAVVLSRVTPYRPPRFLDSIVTKIHPPSGYLLPGPSVEGGGTPPSGRIHAFLPAQSQIEFGAISPKGNHLTVNIAGASVTASWMDYFLALPAVATVLPPSSQDRPLGSRNVQYFKGRFPVSLARGFYGDRYVVVGDAAGLVRAFKGKGVNSACLTGMWAARSILTEGISAAAFERSYVPACREILADIPYGQLVRRLVIIGSRLRLVDPLLALAEREPALSQALFDAVSGRQPYRAILRQIVRPTLFLRATASLFQAAASRHSTT